MTCTVLVIDYWNLRFTLRLAQGGESFDFAQDREPVENPELVEVVERLVEPFVIWCLKFGFLCPPNFFF
jgi:hypothetical protein